MIEFYIIYMEQIMADHFKMSHLQREGEKKSKNKNKHLKKTKKNKKTNGNTLSKKEEEQKKIENFCTIPILIHTQTHLIFK